MIRAKAFRQSGRRHQYVAAVEDRPAWVAAEPQRLSWHLHSHGRLIAFPPRVEVKARPGLAVPFIGLTRIPEPYRAVVHALTDSRQDSAQLIAGGHHSPDARLQVVDVRVRPGLHDHRVRANSRHLLQGPLLLVGDVLERDGVPLNRQGVLAYLVQFDQHPLYQRRREDKGHQPCRHPQRASGFDLVAPHGEAQGDRAGGAGHPLGKGSREDRQQHHQPDTDQNDGEGHEDRGK